jgi:hypothetical protein
MQRRDALFFAAIALGLALRLWLTATTFGTSDVIYKTTWAHLAERFGVAKAYAHSPFMNDPPLAVAASVLLDRHEIAFGDLFRFVQTLADLVSLACLALLAKRETALAYFLSPAAIMISGFHCNSDPSMIAFVLLAALLHTRGRHASSGAALALATGVKVVPLLLLPIFLIASRRHAPRFGAAWTAMMALLFGVPAAIGGIAVLRNTFLYKSVGNWWGVISMLHFAGATNAEHFFRAMNTIVVLAAVAAITLFFARNRITLLAACGLVFTALLVLGAGFGVQYLLWPLAFLPFFAPRIIRFAVHAGAALFLFTVYTHWSRGLPWFFANSDTPDATTSALVVFGWVVWLALAAAAVAGIRAGFSQSKESS